MKITIEDDKHKCTVEASAEALPDVMELIKDALKGFGFHNDTIEEYWGDN